MSQVSYIRTIGRTPIFLPNLGGGSYSLKNTVPPIMVLGKEDFLEDRRIHSVDLQHIPNGSYGQNCEGKIISCA